MHKPHTQEKVLNKLLVDAFKNGAAQAGPKKPGSYLTVRFGYYTRGAMGDRHCILLEHQIKKALDLDSSLDGYEVLAARKTGLLVDGKRKKADILGLDVDVYVKWAEANLDHDISTPEGISQMDDEISEVIRSNHFQSKMAAHDGYKIKSSVGEKVDISVPRPVTR